MQLIAREEIPQTDGEVDAAGHQVVGVVPLMLLVGIDETGDPTMVTLEDPMRGPTYREETELH